MKFRARSSRGTRGECDSGLDFLLGGGGSPFFSYSSISLKITYFGFIVCVLCGDGRGRFFFFWSWSEPVFFLLSGIGWTDTLAGVHISAWSLIRALGYGLTSNIPVGGIAYSCYTLVGEWMVFILFSFLISPTFFLTRGLFCFVYFAWQWVGYVDN